MNNIYSCRKIEDALKYNIHYMWLSGSQTPSFCTINRFRSEHMKNAVNKLSSQVVTLLVEMGQITLEEQYMDGTKIESFNFAVVQRADRRADKYITVFPYLCRKKEGLTAGGQPIAPSRLRAYAPLQALRIISCRFQIGR